MHKIDVMLDQYLKEFAMTKQGCPLAEGDRVDHKIFGLGTVISAPVGMVSPDPRSPKGIKDAGWRIDVKWDDPERPDSAVASFALRKVSSPDLRPYTYWDRHWQPLLQAWLRARREVELLASSFRPLPDQDKLNKALKAEAEAYAAVVAFQNEDARRVQEEGSE